jgi:hypothetical protein
MTGVDVLMFKYYNLDVGVIQQDNEPYQENIITYLDLKKAIEYANEYIKKGVVNTYVILTENIDMYFDTLTKKEKKQVVFEIKHHGYTEMVINQKNKIIFEFIKRGKIIKS